MQNPFHQSLKASNENGENILFYSRLVAVEAEVAAVVIVFMVVVVVVVVVTVVLVVVVVELVDDEEVVTLVLGHLSPVSNGEQ